MTLFAYDAAQGLSPRAGTMTVTAVDEDAGTVTVNATVGGLAAGDFLFREGDPGTCMEGLEVCTPLTAPVLTVDSFRGQDRGKNPTRLAGVRLDGTALDAEVVLARLAVKASKAGKSHNVDQGFLHPEQFFDAAQRLNAKVEYTDAGGTANYGFQYIMIHTAAGTLRVYSDPDCPIDRARVSRKGSQYLRHLEGLPHIVDLDGMPMLRQTDENGIECRVEAFVNLIQDDPAAQGVGSLTAP
jgi:hypothetical protein